MSLTYPGRLARAVVVLGVISIGGCTADGADAPTPPLEPASPLSLFPADDGPILMDGALYGELAMINGCFVVIDHAGEIVVPVLPDARTSHDGDVLISNGTRFELGEQVSFGGGALSDRQESLIPEACQGLGSFWISDGAIASD